MRLQDFADVRCHQPRTKRPKRLSEEASRLIYSNSGLGVATTSNSSAVSRPRSENVGATKGVRPTSDKSSGSSTHILPHEQKEGTKNLDSV